MTPTPRHDKARTFVVPGYSDNEAEAGYAALATIARVRLLPSGRRPYRIVWIHDGQRWTAAIGERQYGVQMRGVRGRPVGRSAMRPAFWPSIRGARGWS